MIAAMRESWQRRIERAAELARADERAAALLTSYGRLLTVQRSCYERLMQHGERLSGSLDRDLDLLRPCAAVASAAAAAVRPSNLEAPAPFDENATDAFLRDGWHATSAPFHARLVLQPYAECLVRLERRPRDRELGPSPSRQA